MPVSFPAKPIGRPDIQAKMLLTKPPAFVPAANIGNPGQRFTIDTLKGGRGKIPDRATPDNPGVNFGLRFKSANVDQRPQSLLISNALWKETAGIATTRISGVSRDSAGAALANCQVMLFQTSDRRLIAETTSDGSGAWSLAVMGGPFFLVEYKDGATPVAGTSLNTLLPVQT